MHRRRLRPGTPSRALSGDGRQVQVGGEAGHEDQCGERGQQRSGFAEKVPKLVEWRSILRWRILGMAHLSPPSRVSNTTPDREGKEGARVGFDRDALPGGLDRYFTMTIA